MKPAITPPPRDAEPEPPVRGASIFRAVEGFTLWVEALSRRIVPDAWNPLLHSGAIANVTLLIATVTGVLLLFWYSPSVHLAHSSMREIEGNLLASAVRALHRYSSDVCMVFVAWHALRLAAARRFTGARWLAWVTGLAATGLLWLVGWLGYWLVWDQAAQMVAVSTARVLDVLPIFSDPLAREFIADGTINSLLFFIVFFVHMLVPMAIGVALWLHIARLQRPDWLTPKPQTLALVGVLTLLSLVAAPLAGAPAKMALVPGPLVLDAWYLLPLLVAERISGAVALGLIIGTAVAVGVVPWALARGKRKPAVVVESRCNACNQCVTDCPYNAIRLVPRTDKRPFKARALVDPNACLGCGICAGSCAGGGSTLPHFDMLLERARLEKLIDAVGAKPIVFACHDALPKDFTIDDATGACAKLPGVAVVKVPCAGWVQAITVERALRKSQGVLVVGCSGHRFREGMTWTKERLAGERHVELARPADRARTFTVEVDRTNPRALVAAVEALVRGSAPPVRPMLPAWAAAPLAAALVAGVTWAGTRVPFTPAQRTSPALAISLRHGGAIEEQCRMLTEAEKAKMPVHMRRDRECQRRRQPVRVEVLVDGGSVLTRSYQPHGMWGDGAAVALEEIALPTGRHQVEVRIGDSADASQWAFRDTHDVELRDGERHAVVFDRARGFRWFPEGG